MSDFWKLKTMPSVQGTWSLPAKLGKKMRELKISPSLVLRSFMLDIQDGAQLAHIKLRDVIWRSKQKERELIGNG